MNIVRVEEVEMVVDVDVIIRCDSCGQELAVEREEEDLWGVWTLRVVPCNCGEKEAKEIL